MKNKPKRNGIMHKKEHNNNTNSLPPIYETEEQHLANQLLYKEPVAPITRKMDDFVIPIGNTYRKEVSKHFSL